MVTTTERIEHLSRMKRQRRLSCACAPLTLFLFPLIARTPRLSSPAVAGVPVYVRLRAVATPLAVRRRRASRRVTVIGSVGASCASYWTVRREVREREEPGVRYARFRCIRHRAITASSMINVRSERYSFSGSLWRCETCDVNSDY